MARKPKSKIARVMIDLPAGHSVWKVLAVNNPDDDDWQYLKQPMIPVECQIIGPVAFLTGPPKTKRRLQRAGWR